ncbi:MucR family transcriptional regulator [Sphingosinicella sp. BN140058]|uniref:MucR family transcriptional regulator n=1 Tax=Sphingosinicella sp. BN140058 TaxID=1892855 RepID=UPI001980614C|nr:MucR family transcriptional regulator [Sphingosinicella sp. BN140058]
MANDQEVVELTAGLVAAHVSNNKVSIKDVAVLIANVHGALAALHAPPSDAQQEKRTPAVSVRASVKPEAITCLDCGSKHRMLKRHLRVAHDLTPAEYRSLFDLPGSYPMVAPEYARQRSEVAKRMGLGSSRRGTGAEAGAEADRGSVSGSPPAASEQPKKRSPARKAATASSEQPKRRGRAVKAALTPEPAVPDAPRRRRSPRKQA